MAHGSLPECRRSQTRCGLSRPENSNLVRFKRIPAETAVLHPGHVNDSFVQDVANHIQKLSHWLETCTPKCNGGRFRVTSQQIKGSVEFVAEVARSILTFIGLIVACYANVLVRFQVQRLGARVFPPLPA